MNIFHLDTDPKTCAKYHCDKHVCKNDSRNNSNVMYCLSKIQWS